MAIYLSSWNKQVSWVLADFSLVACTLGHNRRASLWPDPSLASQCILSLVYDYDLDKYKPAGPFSETASAEHLVLCLLHSKCPIKVNCYQQHRCSWSLGYAARVHSVEPEYYFLWPNVCLAAPISHSHAQRWPLMEPRSHTSNKWSNECLFPFGSAQLSPLLPSSFITKNTVDCCLNHCWQAPTVIK